MIDVVVFDFDGVLVQSDIVKGQAYFRIFEPLGRDALAIVTDVIRERRGGDRYAVISRILRRLQQTGQDISDVLVEEYARRYNEICEDAAATCAEVPGASQILSRLAGTFPLYVNSATPDRALQRIVERRGWDGYFKEILGSGRTKVANLIHILEREGAPGASLLFVGDSEGDRKAAEGAGCSFVGMASASGELRSARDLELLNHLWKLPELVRTGVVPKGGGEPVAG